MAAGGGGQMVCGSACETSLFQLTLRQCGTNSSVLIERCPYFRGSLYIRITMLMLSLERCPYFRGTFVKISVSLGPIARIRTGTNLLYFTLFVS